MPTKAPPTPSALPAAEDAALLRDELEALIKEARRRARRRRAGYATLITAAGLLITGLVFWLGSDGQRPRPARGEPMPAVAPRYATVTGTIRLGGGPPEASRVPEPGLVSVFQGRRLVAREYVGLPRTVFRFHLAPGRYLLIVGLRPQRFGCPPKAITVHSDETVRTKVYTECTIS